MKKIKILYVGMSENLGGIETFLINIVRNMDFNLFEISFLVHDKNRICFKDEIFEKGCSVYEITRRTQNYYKYIRDLKKTFKENEFDYIHFNLMSFSCFEIIQLARKYSSAKIILHSHIAKDTDTSIKNKYLNKIGRFFIKRKDTYIKFACSKIAGEYMFKSFKNPDFIEVNNAIDVEKYKYDSSVRCKLRKKMEICDNETIIGHIGRFTEQKNHKFLIDVFKEYLKINPKSKLFLVGDGPKKNEIEGIVKKLGLEKKVFFLGIVDKINEIVQVFDAFLMPSLYEGLPFVLIEVQSSGLPCLISDTISAEANICDNNIVLSLSDTLVNWARQLDKLVNSEINRTFCNNVLKSSKFNLKNEIKYIEDIYIKNL